MRKPRFGGPGIALAFLVLGAPLAPVATAAGASPAPEAALWVARYDGPTSTIDQANSVAASPDGTRVFVTGSSAGDETGYDIATLAYDPATGSELWLSRYDETQDDQAVSVAVSPDGTKVFVTGFSNYSIATSYDYATMAYDAGTGAQLWTATYDDPDSLDDQATALAVSPDGSKVFVTGHSGASGHGEDYATVAYAATNGSQLWVTRYDAPAQASYDYATALASSPDSSKVFVTGYSAGTTLTDYVTLAYDSTTGVLVWHRRYDGPGRRDDYPYSMAVSPDASKLFVTGASWGGRTDQDYGTVAYDASTGATLWVMRFNGSGNGFDYGKSVVVSPDGSRVYVTGYSWAVPSEFDYTTLAYDAATGVLVWGRRYQGLGGGDDYAVAVAVTPDGRYVYATGYADNGASGYDYASAGYDASTGGSLGARVYNGPANRSDYAFAMAVSSTVVFITGESDGGPTAHYDYATAAYQI